jgi:putative DNA primase/helicase
MQVQTTIPKGMPQPQHGPIIDQVLLQQDATAVEPVADNSLSPSWPVDMVGFITNTYPDGLAYYMEGYHAYGAGFWSGVEERQIRRQISEYYGEEAIPSKTKKLADLLRDFLGYGAADIVPDPRMICLTNGTLNTDSYVLEPHSMGHMLQTHTAIEWNPEVGCPRWLAFLDEIFAPDADKAAKIAFIRQWFGYCLVPDSRQQKFLWLVGFGHNGKSTLLTVLSHLVGEDNAAHLHLDQLKNKFERAELKNKLVNISVEISVKAKIADGYMKAIVSGDTMQAERKFKDPFKFRPYARLIAATNKLPKVDDVSEGFFRRAILLEFNRKFTLAERDIDLDAKLLAELPGILVWAVQGLKELRDKGQFDIPSSSVAALHQYREETDVERHFVKSCVTPVTRGGHPVQAVYDAYIAYCKAGGFDSTNIIAFGKRLVELGVNSRRAGGKKYWLVEIAS